MSDNLRQTDRTTISRHDERASYDRDVANAYMEHILSAGNRQDAADAWQAFRGREVDTAALMRARGFPVAE